MNLYENAACKGRTDIEWFPIKNTRHGPDLDYDANLAAARRVCAGCPVRAECRKLAFSHPFSAGIWAGTDEYQRDGRTRRDPVVCGTWAGYRAHLAQREPTCAECRAANAARVRAGRARATPEGRTHGRRSTYMNANCRCDACCQAAREYRIARKKQASA